MAVIVKYVVERNGVEKMTSISKKEADAYDKMLDVAEGLSDFLTASELLGDDKLTEELSLFLAQHSASIQQILKGGKVKHPAKANSNNDEKTNKAKKDNKNTVNIKAA